VDKAPTRWKKLALPLLVCALFLPRCTGNGNKAPEWKVPATDPEIKPDELLSEDALPEDISEAELARMAEETAGTNPLASHLTKQYTDDLDGLRKRRYIRVLTTFDKTNFFLDGSQTFGYEYSQLQGYEKYLNRGLKRTDLKVVLEFIPASRDRLIPLLVSGYGDIVAAGILETPENMKRVDFTIPYLSNVEELIVANRNVKGLHSLKDLAGRAVYVRPNSDYWASLERLNVRFRREGMRPVKIRKAPASLEPEDLLEMVNAGAIPMTVSSSQIARLWESVFKNLRVCDKLAISKGGKIAWAVRKNNPELRASLNAFLKTCRKGTLLGNIYLSRYFDKNQWILNPFNREDREKRKRYRVLIKQFADRYGFDPLLIQALAYQESKLNHGTVGASGAEGIMQIHPETAADENIGIRNIQDLENNIHAGVKYLAFLRDQYFGDKHLRERDRIRFALAAYNAGPARIEKARELAKKMGLNPDKWFRNVEIAVLKEVGQTTVQYVSNINKYYLLFKFNEEHEQEKKSVEEKMSAVPG
jgi:membrane-bound lytic murein transglycosylase MltF